MAQSFAKLDVHIGMLGEEVTQVVRKKFSGGSRIGKDSHMTFYAARVLLHVAAQLFELRQHESGVMKERLARWRFDGLIAATALVAGMPLVHNNAADFEAIRSGIECAPERFPRLGPLELLRCTSLA